VVKSSAIIAPRPDRLAFTIRSVCYGLDDESFYDSLVRMFKQAVTHALVLSEAGQEPYLERLGKVMAVGQDMGWGVGDDFADTWAEAGLDA